MKQMSQVVLVVGLGMASGLSYSAPGYVDNDEGSVVRTGSGDCLHTTRWSIPNAIAECDAEIVAARDKVEVAAVEIVLNPVRLEADTLFEFDSNELTVDGTRLLDDLVGNLTAAGLQEQKLQITGYADRIGEDDYNLGLSQRRAAAVRDYLISKGVLQDYIEADGLGTANPVVGCEGERGAALVECLAPNRRTEVEFSAMEAVEVVEEAPAGQ
ncbi:MAG: OmpA family protein [Thiogranum sp.]